MPTTINLVCGKDSVIKVGTNALQNARSIQATYTQTEVETTAHGASVKTYEPVILDIEISHKMLAFEGDTELDTILTAMHSKTALSLEVRDSTTGWGCSGSFKVMSASPTYNDDGGCEYDIKYKPCRAASEVAVGKPSA